MKPFSTLVMVCMGLATGVLGCAAPVSAQEASGSFRVSAQVPVACWVDHSVRADAVAGTLGSVTEGCNSASGYVVSAAYRPLTNSERAQLVYGGQSFTLSDTGLHEVRREHGPRIQQIDYRFDNVALDAPLTLSLMIQPL